MKTITYTINPNSPVEKLLTKIQELAESKNYHLGRWDTASRQNSFCRTITWGIYQGDRPAYSRDCRILISVGNEANGVNSKIYKNLQWLLEKVKLI